MTTEHSKNKVGRQLKKEDIPIDAKEDEIEVTESMRDAGAGAYYAGDLRFESAGDIAAAIYRAMETARHFKD